MWRQAAGSESAANGATGQENRLQDIRAIPLKESAAAGLHDASGQSEVEQSKLR